MSAHDPLSDFVDNCCGDPNCTNDCERKELIPAHGVSPCFGKEILYTVPLDDSREAYLWLPKRLVREDAERMERFIAALVIEETAE